MSTYATLEPVPLQAVPGAAATCRLTVRNTSDVVEAYQLDVAGDAADWSHVDPPTLRLYPGGEATASVVFEAPRSAQVPAGEVPFAVRVVPSERPDDAVAPEGVVVVEPYVEATAEVVPRTSRGRRGARHEVAVDNRGNVPVTAVLSCADPDGRVTARARPDTLTVAPGQAAFATLAVRNRRLLWRGTPVTHPFQVVVACGVDQPVVLDAATLQTPVVPRGAGRLAAALATLAVLLAAGWLYLLQPAVRSAAKEAVRAPLAKVAQQADSAGKKADAAQKKADAAGSGGTVTGNGGGGEQTATKTPARVHLATANAAGSTASDSYTVPDRTTLLVTDLVLENPQGDTGRVDVLVEGTSILTESPVNYRVFDLHFVSPIRVPAGKALTIRTTCQTPGATLPGTTGNQCRVWMLATGTSEAAQT
jgi:hypothetical protein